MYYLRYLYLIAYSGVQHILTICVTCRMSYKRQILLALRGRLGLPSGFVGVRVAQLFSFLCCDFCFVRLRLVYPNVASVSGLSILDCPFGFI